RLRISHHTRNQTANRLYHGKRCDFSPVENIISNGHQPHPEVLSSPMKHALVNTFITTTSKNQMFCFSQLISGRLAKDLSRSSRHYQYRLSCCRSCLQNAPQRYTPGFSHHYHTRATTVERIVNRFMPVKAVIPQVVHVKLKQLSILPLS